MVPPRPVPLENHCVSHVTKAAHTTLNTGNPSSEHNRCVHGARRHLPHISRYARMFVVQAWPDISFFFFFTILFYAGFEAFPGVSSQLSGSRLNAPQKPRLMCGSKSWKKLGGEEQEERERGGRLTCSLSTGKVIYDSWRDRTGCQVCVNFLLLLFFQL